MVWTLKSEIQFLAVSVNFKKIAGLLQFNLGKGSSIGW